MKNKQNLVLPIGTLLMGIAILMEKFLPLNNFLDFIEGLFVGLTIVFNVWCIISFTHKSNLNLEK